MPIPSSSSSSSTLPPLLPLGEKLGAPFSAIVPRLADALRPPDWLTDELRNRLVLALNHVLTQNAEATARLAPLAGRVARLQWRTVALQLRATPAGLCEAAPDAAPDLTVTLAGEAALDFAKGVLRREKAAQHEKPAVRIEGDAHLATELNWLAANVRWHADEDVRRLLPPAAAHVLLEAGRAAAQALRGMAARVAAAVPGKAADAADAQGSSAP